MNTDGSEPINISRAPTADDYGASWSPDGLKLLFLSNRANTNIYQIYVVDADGSNLIDLTPNNLNNIVDAVWSPDGSYIAFVRTADNGGTQVYNVWKMSANGGNTTQVSNLNVFDLSGWSPDSQNLLVTQTVPDYTIVLGVLSADPSHSSYQELNTCNCHGSHAGWAPGPQIVWDYQNDIFTASTDRQIIRNVTEDPNHYNARPRMSPDGRTIVFQGNISGHDELWSVDSDGGIRTRLTRNDAPDWGNDSSGDVLNSISDDGSLVAFTRIPAPVPGQTDLRGDIGVVDIHGANLRLFSAPNGTNARQPVFSHCPTTSMPTLHPTDLRTRAHSSTLK